MSLSRQNKTMMLKYDLLDEYGNRIAHKSYVPARQGLKELQDYINTYMGET